MSDVIKIRKGLNIPLKGNAEKIAVKAEMAESYSVKPVDFNGILTKLNVKEGEEVKAGDALFYHKDNPDILFTSPVSGQVQEIRRGAKRKILEVIVKPDKKQDYTSFQKGKPGQMTREEIIRNMMKSGLWPALQQRPYNVLANPEKPPKAIFISCFDTAPLAPDIDFLVRGEEQSFQTGLEALKKLTDGKIHLGMNAEYPASPVFKDAKGVEKHWFKGPHPAGNVGIQIHHIEPINKGESVWTIKPQHVIAIGRLFEEGIYDTSKVIAITGSEINNPKYHKLIAGASIKQLLENNIQNNHVRCISGNVLTGSKIEPDGHLGFFDNQVTVIPEGDNYEMFGWAKPGLNKYSMSGTFLSKLTFGRRFKMDTNLHGGYRAYVITGQYEKVLPMDIYAQQLIKSIMIEDIDQMEQLGIYEVVEEDLALCEFVCTSKTEVQSILRQGIDLMIKELE